ncbi:BOI-related E3 ubiquitin-protein ligase 1-like isoform X1 [Zingiber officinale]|uniref:BOI-related E3 ubiquitin-protein ligase 1-like isoform X1 n=2 Tax=Zingiber officinale TaxID=94328 RepID=UPI001C4C6D0A|nr:BOI-related E3 ubiquitin-protein ligase 1-like isoform X1 [Zingiber officinale]
MAVHSRRACNFPFQMGGERDRKEMDLPRAAAGFLDPSALLLTGGAAGNPRKRGAESIADPAAALPQQNGSVDLLSLRPQHSRTPFSSPVIVTLAQVQSHPPPVVSTGLRLSLEEQYQQQTQTVTNPLPFSSSSLPSFLLSNDLISQIDRHKEEIEQFLRAQVPFASNPFSDRLICPITASKKCCTSPFQGEQLQIALVERHRMHYRSLLCAASVDAANRIREKQAEVERAAQRSAELQNRLVRLRSESNAWQAKAMADQVMAASLHSQLQQAAAAAAALSQARSGDAPPAEDAGSAIVDPNRNDAARTCRACRGRPAMMVLLPCRHLCLCEACDAAVDACPVCESDKTGRIRVFLA